MVTTQAAVIEDNFKTLMIVHIICIEYVTGMYQIVSGFQLHQQLIHESCLHRLMQRQKLHSLM